MLIIRSFFLRSEACNALSFLIRLFTKHQLRALKTGMENPQYSVFALMSRALIWFFGPVLFIVAGYTALKALAVTRTETLWILGPIPSVILLVLKMLLAVLFFAWFFSWYLICADLMRGRSGSAEEKMRRLEERLKRLEDAN